MHRSGLPVSPPRVVAFHFGFLLESHRLTTVYCIRMNRRLIHWICVVAVLTAMLPLNGWGARCSVGASGMSGQCSIVESDHVPSCCARFSTSSTDNSESDACAWLGAWCSAPGCNGACFCCSQRQLVMIIAAGSTLDDGKQAPPDAVAPFSGLSSPSMNWRERLPLGCRTGPPGIRSQTLLGQLCLLLV